MSFSQSSPISDTTIQYQPGKFSGSMLIVGTLLFIICGLLYWLDLRDSGLTVLFRRAKFPLSPWIEYYVHLLVSMISIAIINSSNFLQAMAYNISIQPSMSAFLKAKLSAKNLVERKGGYFIIGIISIIFLIVAGVTLLDIIDGDNIPKSPSLICIGLLILIFFSTKIKYYPYITPVSLSSNSVTDRHMIWETYQTPGRIKLGSDQYAYQAKGDDKFKLISNHNDIQIEAMTKVFFIQPDKINFKGNRQSLGVGNVRGNIFFDIELRMNKVYFPLEMTERQLSLLQDIFLSEAKAFSFIKDNIDPGDIETALTEAGNRSNLINSYFISHKAAVEEDSSSILSKITDLSGYRDTLLKMRAKVRQGFDDMFGEESNKLIRFDFNIIDDGNQEKQVLDKIEAARAEAQKFLQHIIGQFVTAITNRIGQRGGNIDITLVERVNDVLNNLTGRPTYSTLLESKRQISTLNEEAKKKGLKNLGNLEELKDE